jgi:hypothetical protein
MESTMPSRRRTWSTPASVSPAPGDWCWCGNRVVARCVDCQALLCERHRLQDGTPPPDLAYYQRQEGLVPAWPYRWEEAWAQVEVDPGWLGFALAEQLFHTGYGTRPEVALCQECRSRAGVQLIESWRAIAPPADGWDRALWLLDQGFEPSRVVMTVNVGPPSHAVRRFLALAASAGLEPDSTLAVLWSVDRQNRTRVITRVSGWMLRGAATLADVPPDRPALANVFVSTEGETYIVGKDLDPTTGRILPSRVGRVTEYKRLPDDRWRPALLALYAFERTRGPAPA